MNGFLRTIAAIGATAIACLLGAFLVVGHSPYASHSKEIGLALAIVMLLAIVAFALGLFSRNRK